jgi:predicted nucleotidyltransferase
MSDERLRALSATTGERLDGLRAALLTALGDDLVSLIVYGSLARGGYRDGQSDVDLAIVVRQALPETLAKIANAIQLARYAARIESMILVADEIEPAVDVFPLLYDDIRRHHIVLWGSDPFDGLAIPRRYVRLRAEQELRDAQIRLRRLAVDAFGSRGAVAGAILRKAKQIRSPLYALLSLRGVATEDRTGAVLAKAGEFYGVETAAILQARAAPDEALDQVVRLLALAVADADTLVDA